MTASAVPYDHETANAIPIPQKKPSKPRGTNTPLQSTSTNTRRRNTLPDRNKTTGERQNRPPIQNKTIQPRDRAPSRRLRQRPLNRETRGDRSSNRPTPITVSHPATHHPKHTIERDGHNSKTDPEKDDARVDNEPFHNEAHRAAARATTTTRGPALRTYTPRVVERTRKRNTVTKTHFRSDLSNWMGWYVIVNPCRSVSYDVNAVLLQHATNLLNIIHIHASNADTAVDIAVTVLNNFDLKRDAVQTENDLPTQ